MEFDLGPDHFLLGRAQAIVLLLDDAKGRFVPDGIFSRSKAAKIVAVIPGRESPEEGLNAANMMGPIKVFPKDLAGMGARTDRAAFLNDLELGNILELEPFALAIPNRIGFDQ
ncbi:MAG: hypothetical protein ACOY3K_05115 [Candidatus Omnitrophota bacterium]